MHIFYKKLFYTKAEISFKTYIILFQAFPVVFALMKRKTANAYKAVFKYLKTIQPNLDPRTVISDYERAIKIAVSDEFPLTDHHGCWFHYCQVRK